MSEFKETLLVLFSVPVYVLVIGAELVISQLQHKKVYSRRGIFENVYLTLANMGLDIVMRGVCLMVLAAAYDRRLLDLSHLSVLYWILIFVFEDFMFYWLHRIDHHCRLFWAVHVTHHSSREYNLTVGFRSSVLQPLYRFVYFIPVALCGFKPLDIMFAYSAAQIVGVLAHTQLVARLGFLEYIFVTPSHHRVHHASNVQYLDRNMGMLLIIWDKLFGTFEPEDESVEIRYGLTHEPENAGNPVGMVFHEWRQIWKDVRKPGCTLRERLMYVFGPPGWSHDGSRKTSAELRNGLMARQLAHGHHSGS